MTTEHVWYASYGSNLCADRFACYLRGGRPDGGRRTYPGVRAATPPVRDVALTLPGRVYFAGNSTTWGGGMAFYDPDRPGPTAARAYLVTLPQFADIALQEMNRSPRPGTDVERVLADRSLLGEDGASHRLGDGRYARLLRVGTVDGARVLTFTAPHGIDDVPHVPPSAPYLAVIGRGLHEAHGWAPETSSAYLRMLVPGPDRRPARGGRFPAPGLAPDDRPIGRLLPGC